MEHQAENQLDVLPYIDCVKLLGHGGRWCSLVDMYFLQQAHLIHSEGPTVMRHPHPLGGMDFFSG